MSVEWNDGHSRSIRTDEETQTLLKQDVETLSPEEREVVELILKGLHEPDGGAALLKTIKELEWVRTPVGMEEFVMNPYYLGNTCDNLYPQLLQDLRKLFDGDYREAVFTGAIGWGKCGTGVQWFVDGLSGKRVTLQEAAEWGGDLEVPSLEENGEISHRPPSCVWKSGRKECSRLTLQSGQTFEGSLDHPVLTPEGYLPLGELAPGDLVAAARSVPAPMRGPQMSDNEVALVGALIADGGLTQGQVIYTKRPDLCERVAHMARDLSGLRSVGIRKDGPKSRTIALNGVVSWCCGRDIMGTLSKHKRVPPDLFGLNDSQLAILLRWIFTDGNVYTRSPRKIEICLASEGLIDDLQYLLRRFGVVARKSYKPKTNRQGTFDAWRLQIADAPMQLRFLDRVGPIPGREAECEALREVASKVKSAPNWDVVPVGYDELKEIRKETGPHEKKRWAKIAGLQKGSWMGREKFLRLCDEIGYRGKYYKLAAADVVWEKVESVESIGVHDVYDLTVPETHNAVVNGIVVHNTFSASIGVCYLLYLLSCMRDPHRSFGIAANSNISIVCLSVNEVLATKVAYENIATKIEASPYFQQHFPFEKTKKELRFPKKVWVAARASNDGSVLGLNVIGGLLDECLVAGTEVLMADGEALAIEDLVGREDVVVETFDFDVGIALPAQAWVRRSTDQRCYEIELDDGTILGGSEDHPVAVRRPDGSYEFIVIGDILDGQEVLIHGALDRGEEEGPFGDDEEEMGRGALQGSEGVGEGQVSASRGCQEDARGRSGVRAASDEGSRQPDVWEVALRLAERANLRSQQGPEMVRRGQEARQDGGRSRVLRGAGLGVRSLGRETAVARVVSKRDLGVQPTYDVSVPGYECFVANGVLVHNTNFMPTRGKKSDPRFNLEDRAETLYNAMQRRMKSRFGRKGRLPGILFVVSSKQTSDDFTGKRVEEAKGDPTIFVRDYALWDVKPEAYYSGKWFHVVVGDDSSPSRVLKEEEDPDLVRSTLSDGCVLIKVPDDFRQDFEQNLEGAIRDLAGVATVAVSPYIQRRDKIQAAVDPNRSHPISVEVWDPSQPMQIYWSKLVGPSNQPGIPDVLERPLLNPQSPRHIHIDPSLRGDATGFAMGHVAGFTEVVRRDDEGNQFPERAPVIVVDLALRIVPPIGGEIILGDVRRLVYQLSKRGFMITSVSMDSWNSADAIQKLNQRGFNAIQLSVDRTMEPYDLLKTSLYEGRLHFYEYRPLVKELQELEHDRVRGKVDHPQKGSKDTADAVAGICCTLTENSQHMPLPMMKSIPKTGDMWMQEHQQAALAGVHGSQDAPDLSPDMILPPFLVGSE